MEPLTFSDKVSLLAVFISTISTIIYLFQAILIKKTIVYSNDSFIFVESTPVEMESPDALGILIRPCWGNSGNTPPCDAYSYINKKVSYDGTHPTEEDFYNVNTGVFERLFVAPKHKTRSSAVSFSYDDLEKQQRKDARLFFWSWVDYGSVFKGAPRKRTEAFFEIHVRGDVRSGKANYIASPYGMHNCSSPACAQVPQLFSKIIRARIQSMNK